MLVSVGLNQRGATVAVREMLAASGDALADAVKVLGPLRGRAVLVLGVGETARLSTRHLTARRASVVAPNRTPVRAALEDRAQTARRAGEIVAADALRGVQASGRATPTSAA